MSQFNISWQRIPSLLSTIRISDILDILVVAYLIYKLIMLIRRTNSFHLARGVLLILIALGLSGVMNLTMVNRLLRRTVELGLIALVILFQPELRRLLERVGGRSVRGLIGIGSNSPTDQTEAVDQVVSACEAMSKERVGALIVFERGNSLEQIVATGTKVDAAVSEELIRNIFFPKASLHDGAMIINNSRIEAAGCVLPLSENRSLSSDLGTRHRAGVGMSESSDALVVIVSEETGVISVAIDGMLKRHLATETLRKLLYQQIVGEDKKRVGVLDFIKKNTKKGGGKDVSGS